MEFHEKLKDLRQNKNMTQKAVATKVGLNVRQYQKYENGEQVPTSTVLSRLCHFFKVPSGYFLDTKFENDVGPNNFNMDIDTPMALYISMLEEIYDIEQDFFSVEMKNRIENLKEKQLQIEFMTTKISNMLDELKMNLNKFEQKYGKVKFGDKNQIIVSGEKK